MSQQNINTLVNYNNETIVNNPINTIYKKIIELGKEIITPKQLVGNLFDDYKVFFDNIKTVKDLDDSSFTFEEAFKIKTNIIAHTLYDKKYDDLDYLLKPTVISMCFFVITKNFLEKHRDDNPSKKYYMTLDNDGEHKLEDIINLRNLCNNTNCVNLFTLVHYDSEYKEYETDLNIKNLSDQNKDLNLNEIFKNSSDEELSGLRTNSYFAIKLLHFLDIKLNKYQSTYRYDVNVDKYLNKYKNLESNTKFKQFLQDCINVANERIQKTYKDNNSKNVEPVEIKNAQSFTFNQLFPFFDSVGKYSYYPINNSLRGGNQDDPYEHKWSLDEINKLLKSSGLGFKYVSMIDSIK
jgi:hypothetical protein